MKPSSCWISPAKLHFSSASARPAKSAVVHRISGWARYNALTHLQLPTSYSSPYSSWLRSTAAWMAVARRFWAASIPQYPSRRVVVRRSGFATLLFCNIPQAEAPTAVTVSVASSSSKSSSTRNRSRPVAIFATSNLFSDNLARSISGSGISFSWKPCLRAFHTSISRHSNKQQSNLADEDDQQQKFVNVLPGNTINHYSYFPLPRTPSIQLPKPADEKHLQIQTPYPTDIKHYYIPGGQSKLKSPDNTKSSSSSYYESWMPRMPGRRPSKAELLARATSTLQRLNIHWRWALFKQVRPITTDDISAFFSWILVGNIIWILLGTTTFCSILLFTMNTVFAQEYIAQVVGNFITKNTGLTVVFENAIVPHWSDGKISFNKVFVSRRPNRGNHRVQKGSQAAAAAAASSEITDGSSSSSDSPNKPVDTGNYTQFDLTIDTVSVTLSLSKWMNGGGIVQDVEVKGLRGIVDRRMVKWDPNDDPVNHKNIHKPGDFEIENFKMEDALVTLHHPGGFRPFRVSIFNCELPRLRKHWLFYDILSANNMSGSYDNSLFTIHPRQLENVSSFDSESEGNGNPWRKVNRLRIDGVNIDHLNRGVQGPFGWIESGNVDMMADIMFPAEEENINFAQVLRDIKASWTTGIHQMTDARKSSHKKKRGSKKDDDASPLEWNSSLIVPGAESTNTPTANKYIVLDLRVQLNNSRAVVPLFTTDLTYINNALIRPIVAYINSRDTYIPINCRIVKRYDDFEGSWTMYDSRLMDDISAAVYDAFAANIMDDEARAMRMRKVGFWSMQLALQLFLLSLGAIA
ncbi:uncharacterized protein SAPINGB_P000687 [Magnusiomyces paraingens]|uniref:Mitochondrial distribution and morphology protein 31 n=1 Tax=Magnusiomyces paraingens TaxID=2606893 RepID=A0A5E8B233_9ASCO|nr:uncharacterized protein SAPINGB_P000687 [Saprochaete ingens]VVT45249.1 unnamed protein product [Saprochaete ingens]